MPKIASFISLGFVELDSSHALPLYRQLYEILRESILTGQLKAGTRLPSTRALSDEWSVSRNTVINAFSQLTAEGYLESRTGFGTRVTEELPEEILQVARSRIVQAKTLAAQPAVPPQLSERAEAVAKIPYSWEGALPRAFCPTLPALDAFPMGLWQKVTVASMQDLSHTNLGQLSALGYGPLREALAIYLQTARGVRCTPDQVIITNGTQQALTTTINFLLNRNAQAWMENPSYIGIRAALQGALADIVPVRVDEEGLVVDEGIEAAPDARLAFISPSHQYPLGVTMSLARRLRLLQWAAEKQSWIVEDDYDSEYRYAGYPLSALQGLDHDGRVIYIGSFSKVLYPALRIGYMVVPHSLIKPLHAVRAHADRGVSLLSQMVLERFITEGHFARHIRRMRTLYADRQQVLVEAVETHLDGLLDVVPNDAGLHLVGWLPPQVDGKLVDDQLVSNKLLKIGIDAPSLSSLSMQPLTRSGLVLGYTSVPAVEIAPAVVKMRSVLAQFV